MELKELVDRYKKLNVPAVSDVLDKMGCWNHIMRNDIRPLKMEHTSMGGAFSKVITTSPVISEMGEVIAHTNFPAILVPFCIAAVLFTAVGSGTTAAMTCAGIVAPMLPILGISPVAAALSGACGCLVFTHANNSGFWISAEYFHLDLKQSFKWQTLADGFAGIVSLILLVMIHAIGLV